MVTQLLFGTLILISVACNTLAQTLLKLGSNDQPLNFYLLGGIGAYGISTIFYILVLSKLNLSIAYPIVIGLTILSTTVAGVWVLKETVSTSQWIGIGLMLSAIFAIAFGSTTK